jgi:hypothetical protein
VSQPVRYAVLNDYKRRVGLDNPRAGAFLNGDTCVRPPLKERPARPEEEDGDKHWIWPEYFDITEQWPEGRKRPWDPPRVQKTTLLRKFTKLLYSPLPRDLPTTHKNTLIVMAAYEGNVDRYHRLRRPEMVHGEEEAAIRGIYHSTTFAKFWHNDEDGCATDWRHDAALMARFLY